jgi:DNA replication protein DnaC
MTGSGTAAKCECMERKRAEKILARSGLAGYRDKTFANFEPYGRLGPTKEKLMAYDHSTGASVLIVGQVGSGKTHLSMAIANRLLDKGVRVVYMPYRSTITAIKQNMLDPEFYRKEIDKYINASVLVIDDLFKGKITDSDINIMFEIVNHRYLNRRPIIISSEKTLWELMDIDEAVASRLYEMSKGWVVEIKGIKYNYRTRGMSR